MTTPPPGAPAGADLTTSAASASDSNVISNSGYNDIVAIHDLAARFFRDHLADSWVPGYLAGRGFSPRQQAR
jgi:hypothetical protein